MHRLICAFVVRIWHKQVFSWRGSIRHIFFHDHYSKVFFSCIVSVDSLFAQVNIESHLITDEFIIQLLVLLFTVQNKLVLNSAVNYRNELLHDKTNKMTCAQRRLRSAWASAQSDQSRHCAQGPVFLNADSEDCSDWAYRSFCWFYSGVTDDGL